VRKGHEGRAVAPHLRRLRGRVARRSRPSAADDRRLPLPARASSSPLLRAPQADGADGRRRCAPGRRDEAGGLRRLDCSECADDAERDAAQGRASRPDRGEPRPPARA
jgi:hypothetical protein